MDIIISYRYLYFFKKKITRNIPQNWREITPPLKNRLLNILAVSPPDTAIQFCAFEILALEPKIFHSIDPDTMERIHELLTFLTFPLTKEAVTPYFEVDGIKYYLPDYNAPCITAYDFALAYDYYKMWLSNPQDAQALLLLAAALCRPLNPSQNERDKMGDMREPMFTAYPSEVRAEKFKNIESGAIYAVLGYFTAVMEFVIESGRNANLFPKPPKNRVEEEEQETTPPTDSTTFWQLYNELAKTNVFNGIEDIWRQPFYFIYDIILRNKIDNDKAIAEMKRKTPSVK
jgi:hypothetical protein